jgi:hypothetical protein
MNSICIASAGENCSVHAGREPAFSRAFRRSLPRSSFFCRISSMDHWLGRVQHDLVKRVLWPARDRRDLGGTVAPGELRARLVDDEGGPVQALDLWRALRAGAPADMSAPALDRFGEAVAAAAAAAERGDVGGVLALETAFASLRAGR